MYRVDSHGTARDSEGRMLRCSQCGGHRAMAPIPSLDPKFKIAYCYDCRTERLFKIVEEVGDQTGSVLSPSDERNLQEGIQLRDLGMSRASAGAGPWSKSFDTWVRYFADHGMEFTSEDVTAQAGQPPKSGGAVGARMAAAVRRGWIERVGYRLAERPNQHAARITVWRGKR